jgi:adenylate cyclase
MSFKRAQTILFADVSGSTRLFETKGDVEARRLISMVLNALGEICERHGGRVIKTIGDEVMCTLPTAPNGVQAACEMQRMMGRDINFVRENLAIRIGLHHGDALDEGNDVFGDAVNVASRMSDLAKRQQIVTTATTTKLLGDSAPEFRSLGRARVDGKLLPIEIVDVIWMEDTAGMTMVQSAIRTMDIPSVVERNGLKLVHRGKIYMMNAESEPFMLGREASSQLVIEADWVSRTHAQIEFKRGFFLLTDRSTNACFVKFEGDNEIRLHREELHLRKSGILSLGKASELNPDDLIRFELV